MLKRLTPLVALATGACFATRSDVQILQNDLRVLQAEQAGAKAAADSALRAAVRRDSITSAQLDQLLGALRGMRDSATATTVRL